MCPLKEFDLSLWVTAVFWKEEVVYKEMRRARDVLVPLRGHGQSLKPLEAGGESARYRDISSL